MTRVTRYTLIELLSRQYPELHKDKLMGFIACRNVTVNKEICTDPKARFPFDSVIDLYFDQFVSRGGYKLNHALDRWSIDLKGMVFLDAGSSTGGFTDCLLQRGARYVHSVDVGYNQLDYKLRINPRVIVHERQNIMELHELDPPCDAAVADLSFRSINKAASHIFTLVRGDWIICLIKPQFEIPRETPGFDGVVHDPVLIRDTLIHVKDLLAQEGVGMKEIIESPIQGRKGNREFLALLERNIMNVTDSINPKIDALFS